MYATVMTPKIAPGSSLSMLYCANRISSLTGASTIDVIPGNLASVVDAFISFSRKISSDDLGQGHQRADDVSERDQAEHDTGQFAEQTVLREARSGGGFDRFVVAGDCVESCFVSGCVHFQVPPYSLTDRG